MKEYKKRWLKKLQWAWTAPNKNYLLWKTCDQIVKNDSGDIDPLTQELAKWVLELQN